MNAAELNSDGTLSVIDAKSDSPPHPYEVLGWIAAEALRKAMERGHVPGCERQYWLDAEDQVLAQVYGLSDAVC